MMRAQFGLSFIGASNRLRCLPYLTPYSPQHNMATSMLTWPPASAHGEYTMSAGSEIHPTKRAACDIVQLVMPFCNFPHRCFLQFVMLLLYTLKVLLGLKFTPLKGQVRAWSQARGRQPWARAQDPAAEPGH